MKALVVASQSDQTISSLQIADVEKPTPAANEVLVKAHAVGLNPVDYKVRVAYPPGVSPTPLAWTWPGKSSRLGMSSPNGRLATGFLVMGT